MEIKILNATRMEMGIEIINGDENKKSKILPKSDAILQISLEPLVVCYQLCFTFLYLTSINFCLLNWLT